MNHRRRARRAAAMTDLPLTPLIDTALTLLIIFMVATPFMHTAIKINLPRTSNAAQDSKRQELVVSIDKEGTIYFDEIALDVTTLVATLKAAVTPEKDNIVFVRADRSASYGTVLELIDHIKNIDGIMHVALACQKVAQQTPSVV